MKNQLLNFNGLYGDHARAILPDFVHCESIETRSHKHDWKIRPHIHTSLFQVFCVESGIGTLLVEQRKIAFIGPCLLVIPENTLHGFEFEASVQGTVLTISASFLDKLFKLSPHISLELSKLRYLPMHDNLLEYRYMVRLISNINAELFNNLPEREVMLQSLFTTFLTAIFRLSQLHQEQVSSQNQRSLVLFKGFLKNIKESKMPQKTIFEYAQELSITPVHLNRICQQTAQKSATQVVHGYFISEAQRLLLHTSLGVSEVAYQLNFEDAAYFSRLFKKSVGVSPKIFREKQQ